MTKIVAFAGRKQSGKSTAADFLIQQYQTKFPDAWIERYAFADTLKQVCVNVLGIPEKSCYGADEDKNKLVDCHWNGKQLTAREVMQIVGSEWFRTMQPNVWAEATIRQIELQKKIDLAVIDDCRFPNEVAAIHKAGGLVIKLNRDTFNSDHISETALDKENYDPLNFDYVIENQFMDLGSKNETLLRMLTIEEIL